MIRHLAFWGISVFVACGGPAEEGAQPADGGPPQVLRNRTLISDCCIDICAGQLNDYEAFHFLLPTATSTTTQHAIWS